VVLSSRLLRTDLSRPRFCDIPEDRGHPPPPPHTSDRIRHLSLSALVLPFFTIRLVYSGTNGQPSAPDGYTVVVEGCCPPLRFFRLVPVWRLVHVCVHEIHVPYPPFEEINPSFFPMASLPFPSSCNAFSLYSHQREHFPAAVFRAPVFLGVRDEVLSSSLYGIFLARVSPASLPRLFRRPCFCLFTLANDIAVFSFLCSFC